MTSKNLCVLAWHKQNPCIMHDDKGKSLLYDSLKGLMNFSARSWYWSNFFYALQYGINTKYICFNVTIIKININCIAYNFSSCLNPLNTNPTKMVKHIQGIHRQQPMNCLSVFDHFVGLALKELNCSGDLWLQ